MGTIVRTTWVDDDGTGRTGSIINNAELQAIFAAVEADVKSANFPLVSTKSVQDALMAAGFPYVAGRDDYYVYNTNYDAGAGYDKLAKGTHPIRFDPAWLTGTWKLEAYVRSDNAAGIATVALFNLSDATPDAAMAGSEVSSAGDITAGQRVLSGAVTFPGGGAVKEFGVKPKSNNAANGVNVIGWRLVRTA